MSVEKVRLISKNEKRNMQMVVTEDGRTLHIPIDRNKPVKPKSNRPLETERRMKKENEAKRKKGK